MSKIKQFFKKKKDEAAFKFKLGGGSLGQGHSLSSSEPATSSSQGRRPDYEAYIPPKRKELSSEAKAAAEAALARIEKKGDRKAMNTSLAAIKARARQELQAEAAALKQENESANIEKTSTPTENVASVFYRCPLVSDEILPKKEWRNKIKEFLYQQLETSGEKALTSCLIIQNCNTKEKVRKNPNELYNQLLVIDNACYILGRGMCPDFM